MKPSNRSESGTDVDTVLIPSAGDNDVRRKIRGAQWNCELLYFLRSFFYATRLPNTILSTISKF